MQHIQPRFSSAVPPPVACSTKSSSSSPSLAVARDEPAPAGFAPWVRSSDCPQAWSQQLLLRILLPLALGSCAGTSFPLNLFHNYRFFFPVFPVAYCQCLLVSEPPGTLRRNTNWFFSGEGMSSSQVAMLGGLFRPLGFNKLHKIKEWLWIRYFFFCV